MKIRHRYLLNPIQTDLRKKMVFVGGPRQVGKTTLALSILNGSKNHPAYLNWDVIVSRGKILSQQLPSKQKLIIFDEIHKFVNWRNLLKGFYDQFSPNIHFLITGSARLDYYRKGGDSLQGRYHYYRLHPFSLRELNPKPSKKDVEALMAFGGFPEGDFLW